MPVYEIEQYEVHAQRYRVKARSEAQAIKKLLDAEAEPLDDGLDYIEICEDLGLPEDENSELAQKLRSLGVSVKDFIPSIRSIEEVE
jgi:hypothetical protein